MPTSQVKITCLGKVPECVTVGIFGTFQVRPWTAEPLRCYKCHRYGHHQRICHGRETCGVCAGQHSTQECTDKHRRGITTVAKCPNCHGKHHAWNQGCPERRKRVTSRQPPPPQRARPQQQGPETRRPPSRSGSRPRTPRYRTSTSRSGSRPRTTHNTGAIPKTTPRQASPPPPRPSQQGWAVGVTEAEVHQAPAGGSWPALPAPPASYRDAVMSSAKPQRQPRMKRGKQPGKQAVDPTPASQKDLPPPPTRRPPPPPIRRPVLASQPDQDILPATPPSEPVEAQHSQRDPEMLHRQRNLEQRLDQYTRSLQEMQRQVASLEQQLLQMLQVQFTRLATDITATLHLPPHQADLLQDLVAQHLDQLTVTAQLRPPRGRYTAPPCPPNTVLTPASSGEVIPPRTRDPRLSRDRVPMTE